MPFGKPKAPKEPKPPKAPKVKKPKKPKKERPPKVKKGKKGAPAPEAVEGQEEGKKKKFPILLLIISLVVVATAAAIVVMIVLPRLSGGDPDAEASAEPSPPVLPTELPVGDNVVPGMALGADEYLAQAVLSKTITYTYTDLVDAGKAAETYVEQLKAAETKFFLVDEEFVRLSEDPDFTAAEGSVLMARNLPKPEPEAAESAEPSEAPEGEESEPAEESAAPSEEPSEAPAESAAPVDEPPDMVLTVRIAWTPGQCVVTADEEEGKVTSPPPPPAAKHPITQRGAVECLEGMAPAELGLPGDSMDVYEVIPMDGTDLVNGITALRMHVYSNDTVTGASDFMGSYLMSIDGEHLYRVNPITDEIVELENFQYAP